MLASLIAERYAKALLLGAKAEKASEAVALQCGALLQALEATPEADAFLASPVAGAPAKLEALKTAFQGQLHPLLEQLLKALLENKRGGFVRAVLREAGRRFKVESGVAEASLATARPLAPAQKALLERELSRQLGRKVQLTPLRQPELLGGAVLRLGDMVYDASLRTQLSKLGRELAAGPKAKLAKAAAASKKAKPKTRQAAAGKKAAGAKPKSKK